MRPSGVVTRLALTGAAVSACALADVFRAPGLQPVTLTYVGDTILPLGVAVPFAVTVEAGGALLPQPRLDITSSDTSVVALTAGSDSLLGKRTATATLTIRLQTALLPDSAPTLVQPLRVRP